MSIDEQLTEFKIKKKEEYWRYKQCFNDDTGEKDESIDTCQWPIGTTAIVCDSILNGILDKNSCQQGCIVKIKCFLSSTTDDLSHHIIPIIQK